jgi:hypothetical protein
MECACSNIDVDNDGTYQLCSYAETIARKDHICGECHRIITSGEKYERFTGMFDGKFYTEKTCGDCLSLRKNFFSGFFFKCLWEEWRENMEYCWYQIPEAKLAALTPAARAKCCEAIENWWINHQDDEEE